MTLKADSGASKHFLKQIDAHILANRHHGVGTSVLLPNKEELHTTSAGTLPLSSVLPQKATLAHVLPGMSNSSLLSIGQLCDADCWALFNKKYLHVFHNARLILTGYRNYTDGLWDVNLHKRPPHASINAIIRKDKTKSEMADFLHACAFSPALPTFQAAIRNNNFVTWPGIHTINFEKFLGDKTSIYLGHLDQVRSNLQSTKHVPLPSSDFFPPDNPKRVKSFETISQIVSFSPKEFAYGDLTGAFPFKSSRGNKYLYILYDFDSNAILVQPLQTRQAFSNQISMGEALQSANTEWV